MVIKHIFLLCLTYCYTPTVNSMEEVEIQILWDTIRGDNDFIDHDHFRSYYKAEDPDELLSVLQYYGYEHTPSINKIMSFPDKVELRMTLKQFTKAASEGRINICSTQAMYAVFEEIILKQEPQTEAGIEAPLLSRQDRHSIFYEDMTKYYGPVVPESQLKNVIKIYGKSPGVQSQLIFPEFTKAINIGDLPKPLYDKIAIQTEIEHLFDKITFNQSDFITSENLHFYYPGLGREDEFRNVIKNYGKEHFVQHTSYNFELSEYRMKNAGFLQAGFAGYIPRFSDELMKIAFMKIIPENESIKYVITSKEFNKYYETIIPASQLKYIIKTNYWKIQDGQRRLDFNGFKRLVNSGFSDGQRRLDFNGFKRLVNSGYLPEPLCDKISAMYTLFKKMIPKEESRTHIKLEDMVKHYGTEETSNLRQILKKYGDWHKDFHTQIDTSSYYDVEWGGGQYLLTFPNFKRVMNFRELSVS